MQALKKGLPQASFEDKCEGCVRTFGRLNLIVARRMKASAFALTVSNSLYRLRMKASAFTANRRGRSEADITSLRKRRMASNK